MLRLAVEGENNDGVPILGSFPVCLFFMTHEQRNHDTFSLSGESFHCIAPFRSETVLNEYTLRAEATEQTAPSPPAPSHPPPSLPPSLSSCGEGLAKAVRNFPPSSPIQPSCLGTMQSHLHSKNFWAHWALHGQQKTGNKREKSGGRNTRGRKLTLFI